MTGTDVLVELRRYAAYLGATVSESHARAVAGSVLSPRAHPTATRHRVSTRRLVAALATVATFAGANVALAAVSNGAVPGDPLYGLDRAYERVGTALGLGSDHAMERLQEAQVLSARGQDAAALSSAGEALGRFDPGAGQDMSQAAQALGSTLGPDGADTAALHAETARLLELAKQVVAASHQGDSGAVSAAAEALHAQATQVVDAAQSMGGPPSTTPGGGPPSTTPGGGQETGPPTSTPGRQGPPSTGPSATSPGAGNRP